MKKTITGQIRKIAIEVLAKNPEGIRYSELKREIIDKNPSFNPNTISGATWDLETRYPNQVYKPDRGVFRLLKYHETALQKPKERVSKKSSKNNFNGVKEEDFYQPFADWIVSELEECTKAIGLGGNILKDKWGTPDVIGIRESKRSDIFKLPTEIIAGEIKTDASSLITAFGQACAYKLFSHKSYIVVPKSSQVDDIARLDALCRQFGIGLILFDSLNNAFPQFTIRVRAIKNDPDMFYVNKYLKIIEDKLFK